MQTDRLKGFRWPTVLALAALTALVVALYAPYVRNPLLFDDKFIFSAERFAEHAAFPLGQGLRFPGFFSIAFVHTVFGGIEAHRIVSLLLHAGCAWALYGLLRALAMRRLAAFAGAALFAAHPVAVYGAAYLAQRPIVVATLFSLLALILFARGLRTQLISDVIPAAALYSLAVLSKEHAVLLPAAAAALVPILGTNIRFSTRYTLAFFALCAPVAILVVYWSRTIIGTAYEPNLESIMVQVSGAPGIDVVTSPWLASMLVQTVLFFRYLRTWLLPSTDDMALDVRIDFAQYWAPAMALPAVMAFVTLSALAIFLILRRSRAALAAWGFLYFVILFGTEFSAVRFQEPFVLYRSYLWAPGILVAVASGLDRLPPRLLVAALVPVLALLSWQAHDRLRSLSNGLAAWEDSAAKLPQAAVPGGYRPLYELGREYLHAGRLTDAVDVVERCIRLYPGLFECAFARAAIQIEMKDYEKALPSIVYVLALRPRNGLTRHHLGFVLENLGCRKEALAQYRLALELGFIGAKFRLQAAETPGKGLVSPVKAARHADCEALLARYPIPKPG